jgi:HAD superfamily hydrolase (TIGR01509 family)
VLYGCSALRPYGYPYGCVPTLYNTCMNISALIFDFDGLMVDTETPAFVSWQRIYAEHGHELTLERWQGALGSSHGFDALAYLADLVRTVEPGRDLDTALIAADRQRLKVQLSAGYGLLPGVVDLLDAAEAAGLLCAVASSSSRTWVEGWLSRLGLRERFVAVQTADDVVWTKPDPALFLQAAAGLGHPPAACLVFEDSANGIRAARAAGCPVVAVPGPTTYRPSLPPPDLLLERLDALTLQELIAAVEQMREHR